MVTDNAADTQQIEQQRLSAFDEGLDKLLEALECLYIKGNQSGRLLFREAWPHAASYLFGPELIGYDTKGVTDKGHRNALEEEAELRRLELLDLLEGIDEKSVKAGSLQIEFVQGVLDRYGRELSCYIFASRVIDKLRPPSPGDIRAEEAKTESRPVVSPAPAATVAREQVPSQDAAQENRPAVIDNTGTLGIVSANGEVKPVEVKKPVNAPPVRMLFNALAKAG